MVVPSVEVERWAKSTAGPDWTISLGWGTFSTVVSSFLATPKTILEPSSPVVHPRLEPFQRGKNIFTVEQGTGTVERSIRYCAFTRYRYCFAIRNSCLTNGHSDCSIVVLRGQDPAMFFKKLLQLDFIIVEDRDMNLIA